MTESLKLTVKLLEEHLITYSNQTTLEAHLFLRAKIERFKERIRNLEDSVSVSEEEGILENMNSIMEEFESLKI